MLELAKVNKMEFAQSNSTGKYFRNEHYFSKHIELILNLPLVDSKAIKAKNFKIVVDGINSTGGIIVPQLLKALGVSDIIVLNGEVDGNFAHNPEPLAENLLELSQKVKKSRANLGIAVDPDVDRLVFVNEDGSMFGEEYTLVSIADYILQHKKGNTVSNLSSTRALKDITEKSGFKYFPAAVGEVNVVSVMKTNKAVIGGEGNGGVIYPELHYGRDALVGIALFLTNLAKSGISSSALRAKFPNYFISKNKIELTPTTDVDNILENFKKKYKKYPLNTEDGVRIEFEKEWVHLRKSNTEPIIRIYAESNSETTAVHLANKIISDIREMIRS